MLIHSVSRSPYLHYVSLNLGGPNVEVVRYIYSDI